MLVKENLVVVLSELSGYWQKPDAVKQMVPVILIRPKSFGEKLLIAWHV